MRIRMLRTDFDRLHAHLFQNGVEQHAFLLAELAGDRLLVRDLLLADPKRDVLSQSPVYVSLRNHYVVASLEEAIGRGMHLIDVHSHPFCDRGVTFSSTDYRSAAQRFEWHRERAPMMTSVGLVFGRSSVDGRVQQPGSNQPEVVTQLEIAGRDCETWPMTSVSPFESEDRCGQFDRQIMAFGAEGQSRISSLHVGVVGLGGTGSALVTQLAHLGVQKWTLIDADRVERANLNRLIGARISDVGTPKVEIAERVIRGLSPGAEITIAQEMLPAPPALRVLTRTDILFGCGDNAGVRVVLASFAAKNLIPYIDLGTAISVESGHIGYVGGQVFGSWPGAACLSCYRRFDGHAAAAALRSRSERESHEAVYGTDSPQPSVVTINSAVASVAAGEFLKYATGWHQPATLTLIDARTNRTETVAVARDAGCPICARGVTRNLPEEDPVPLPIRT